MKEDPISKAFGARLVHHRKKIRMTQLDLAKRVGLGRTTIANIERGRQTVSLPLFFRFAIALNVPVGDLLPSIQVSLSGKTIACDVPGAIGNVPNKAQIWAEEVLQETEKKLGEKAEDPEYRPEEGRN